jgi:hypothetical protein
VKRPLYLSLLAAFAGPALAGPPSPDREPSPARAAAAVTSLIDAHRGATAGSGLPPLRLAPAPQRPRLCIPVGEADPAADAARMHDRPSDARTARIRA